MDREDIDLKVIQITEELNADYYDCDDNPLYRKVDVTEACMQMDEWMQEQTIEKACELYCSLCIKRNVCIKLHGYHA